MWWILFNLVMKKLNFYDVEDNYRVYLHIIIIIRRNKENGTIPYGLSSSKMDELILKQKFFLIVGLH